MLLDVASQQDAAIHVVVLPRLEGHRNRTVDEIERPMPFDLAGLEPDFLGDAVSVRMECVPDHDSLDQIRLDFEVSDRDPDRIDVGAGRHEIAQAVQDAVAEHRVSGVRGDGICCDVAAFQQRMVAGWRRIGVVGAGRLSRHGAAAEECGFDVLPLQVGKRDERAAADRAERVSNAGREIRIQDGGDQIPTRTAKAPSTGHQGVERAARVASEDGVPDFLVVDRVDVDAARVTELGDAIEGRKEAGIAALFGRIGQAGIDDRILGRIALPGKCPFQTSPG